MIDLKTLFWQPVGWKGWVHLQPGESLDAENAIVIFPISRKFVLIKKISHQQVTIIATFKFRIKNA